MQENVKRGIAWLNSTEPEWRQLINEKSLDLGDVHQCLLGQVFGSYILGCEKLCPGVNRKDAHLTFVQHGFTLEMKDHYVKKWRELREEWVKQIAA